MSFREPYLNDLVLTMNVSAARKGKLDKGKLDEVSFQAFFLGETYQQDKGGFGRPCCHFFLLLWLSVVYCDYYVAYYDYYDWIGMLLHEGST